MKTLHRVISATLGLPLLFLACSSARSVDTDTQQRGNLATQSSLHCISGQPGCGGGPMPCPPWSQRLTVGAACTPCGTSGLVACATGGDSNGCQGWLQPDANNNCSICGSPNFLPCYLPTAGASGCQGYNQSDAIWPDPFLSPIAPDFANPTPGKCVPCGLNDGADNGMGVACFTGTNHPALAGYGAQIEGCQAPAVEYSGVFCGGSNCANGYVYDTPSQACTPCGNHGNRQCAGGACDPSTIAMTNAAGVTICVDCGADSEPACTGGCNPNTIAKTDSTGATVCRNCGALGEFACAGGTSWDTQLNPGNWPGTCPSTSCGFPPCEEENQFGAKNPGNPRTTSANAPETDGSNTIIDTRGYCATCGALNQPACPDGTCGVAAGTGAVLVPLADGLCHPYAEQVWTGTLPEVSCVTNNQKMALTLTNAGNWVLTGGLNSCAPVTQSYTVACVINGSDGTILGFGPAMGSVSSEFSNDGSKNAHWTLRGADSRIIDHWDAIVTQQMHCNIGINLDALSDFGTLFEDLTLISLASIPEFILVLANYCKSHNCVVGNGSGADASEVPGYAMHVCSYNDPDGTTNVVMMPAGSPCPNSDVAGGTRTYP